MGSVFSGRDLLTLGDLTPEEVAHVLDVAATQKRDWAQGRRETPLTGLAVALIFMKPSMRTRVSFEVACSRLGATPIVLAGSDSVFSRGESVCDSTKVLERYVDCICIRTFEHDMVEQIAEVARVPVINMLTDDYHPCQGLADLLTIKERFGRLEGLRFAYVGDGNNMAHTYLLAGALTGMQVSMATPAGYEPLESVAAHARAIAAATGATIELGHDPREAATGANVVATDTWASMGQEDQHDGRVSAFAGYTVDAALMDRAVEGAIFMHCLPAHRGEEVTDEVMDAPYSAILDEAENRLHVQKALLSLILG